ncbi:MAG: Rrf2 family transcriptional regulator [Thermodesulfovibrionales bacterium]
MFITREADYAVRCVLHLAKSGGKIASVSEVSTAMHVPKSFLAKILQKLAKAGIVGSARGARGGFVLQKQPAEVSLYDVIFAIEGPDAFRICSTGKGACSRTASCTVHPVWIKIRQQYENALREQAFSTLISQQRHA